MRRISTSAPTDFHYTTIEHVPPPASEEGFAFLETHHTDHKLEPSQCDGENSSVFDLAQGTMVCGSRLLPQVEPEVSETLTDVFRGEGITMHCGVTYDACYADGVCQSSYRLISF